MNVKYLLILLTLILTACGGGGGSGSSAPPPAPIADPNLTVPFQTAMANLVNNGINKTFTVTGFVDNSTFTNPVPRTTITGSGTLTIGTPVSATFNGGSVLKVTEVVTGSATANGQSMPIAASAIVYYNAGNYTIAGSSTGTTRIVYAPYTNPSTIKAGSTGTLGSGSTGGIFATTTTSVYTVAGDSISSLLVTIIDTVRDSNVGKTTSQSVYRVTTSGGVTLVSIDMVKNFLGTDYQRLTYMF